MKFRIIISCSLLSFIHLQAWADTQKAPLDFQAVVTNSCDDSSSTRESVAGIVFAQIAAKTVLGLATGLLEEAGKDKVITKSALAHGQLYEAVDKVWGPSSTSCIAFWYGRIGQPSKDLAYPEIMDEKILTDRWRSALGFVETPFLYGEMRLVMSDDMTGVRFQPTRLFARPTPEFSGFLRGASNIAIAVDLVNIGQSSPFASFTLGLPGNIDRPILMSGRGLNGKSSGWFARPDPGAPIPSSPDAIAGLFTAKVVATANIPGSKLAAAMAGALKEEKTSIINALKPQADDEALNATVAATKTAFNALAAVEKAEAALKSATESEKKEFEVKLRLAKYEADVALVAAGYAKRFNVIP